MIRLKHILTLGIAWLVASALSARSNNETQSMTTLFLKSIQKSFGQLSQAQSQSISQIVASFMLWGDRDWKKLIYILATAYHESRLLLVVEKRATPGTPLYALQERYWNSGYYGRGYVQLTHKENYKKMGDLLGINLVDNPDLALDKRYSSDIIVLGMMKGSFTGVGLDRYISLTHADYTNARKVVNGTDRADLIAGYALKIQNNLEFQIA